MNQRLRTLALPALALAFMLSPFAAHAAALTSTQISAIESLLQSFGADADVIAHVDAALTGAPPSPQPAATSTAPIGSLIPKCIVLSGNLAPGSTGSQVIALQQALGVSATGFFGPLTQTAVESIQMQGDVVSSGTPSTTGFGMVGPATRALLANSCPLLPNMPPPATSTPPFPPPFASTTPYFPPPVATATPPSPLHTMHTLIPGGYQPQTY
ncbi:MAG: hypothetical protein ACREGR_04100 [Minisyncoccia bacterium]